LETNWQHRNRLIAFDGIREAMNIRQALMDAREIRIAPEFQLNVNEQSTGAVNHHRVSYAALANLARRLQPRPTVNSRPVAMPQSNADLARSKIAP
jgi:hypothetical protein